jgi:uncharacterized membrane protein YphA (DoxX/SURF4 family)
MQIDEIILIILRSIVGYVFSSSGISKLNFGIKNFHNNIIGYELVPKSVASILAFTIPWIEILLGIALIIGLLIQTTALVACSVLLLFTTALAINIMRGKKHDCGCSSKPIPISWSLVTRNLLLVLLLVCIGFFEKGNWTVDFVLQYGVSTNVLPGLINAGIVIGATMTAILVVNIAKRMLPE